MTQPLWSFEEAPHAAVSVYQRIIPSKIVKMGLDLLLRGLVAFLAVAKASAAFDCKELVLEDVVLPLVSGNATICNKYAWSNMTQYEFITRLVNKAFLGDYPPLPANTTTYAYQATGLLDPAGVYVDPCGITTPIDLLVYFNGSLLSTNRDGASI